ncbi:MAG TPA: carboxypeptidase regulatory-like domain-containing protein [Terriglobales bacterium]|nr:carboxypeptidase regulatory-like domain-containing protein [Terriglobales bacterium]
MRTKAVCLAVFVMVVSVAMYAGSIKGKVSGVSGPSAVWVEAIPGKTFPPPAKSAVMDQKGLTFQPHILVAQVGTTVEFLNSDNVAHNVFWPSISGNKKLGHNMGTWPKGEKKPFKFDQPGVAPMLCNVHPEMSGYIVVVPTPYFAETTPSGEFTIADIPNGSYTVTAWHEGAKNQSKPVSVSGEASVDFTLSK